MAEPELPELREYSLWLGIAVLAGLLGLMAGIWVWSGVWSYPLPHRAASLILGAMLLVLAACDLKAHLLPDVLTLPLLLLGLIVSGLMPTGYLWAGLGAMAGYGLITGLRWLWIRRHGIEAIGLGDAKLLAAGGAWVGASGLPVVLMVSSASALAFALIMGGGQRKRAIPFGVFLALGIWVSWCVWASPTLIRIR